jgi:hypothetical protein
MDWPGREPWRPRWEAPLRCLRTNAVEAVDTKRQFQSCHPEFESRVSQFQSGERDRSFVYRSARKGQRQRDCTAFNIPASYVTSRPRASLPVSDDRSLPLASHFMRPTARNLLQTSPSLSARFTDVGSEITWSRFVADPMSVAARSNA